MSAKNSIYWPVFLIVAALSTAAVWKFAPVVPLPEDCRAWCVRTVRGLVHARKSAAPQQSPTFAKTSTFAKATVDESANKPETSPQKPEARNQPSPRLPPSPRLRWTSQRASQNPEAQKPETRSQKPETKVEELAQAEASDDAIAMTPAQRKKKYEELTKKAEARRLQVLRENLTRSEEGRKALAAVKAFKDFAAKVDDLKKKYGETDSRVTSKRGELLRLKDDVRRTNDAYKRWKEKNPQKFVAPEADEEYRKIIGERQLYAE